MDAKVVASINYSTSGDLSTVYTIDPFMGKTMTISFCFCRGRCLVEW